MKLNLGCGRNTKEGFINIDAYQREKELDIICDLARDIPVPNDSCDYIYAEHLIEHFTWLEGNEFLLNCFNRLKEGGILRLVLPDYKKIFTMYIENNKGFFDIFKHALNYGDLPYYNRVYNNPEQVLKERPDNPPPKWHTSPRKKDREKLALRVKYYVSNIEIVNWFTHQYGEHKTLYDLELLENILYYIGFSEVKETGIIDGFDSPEISRVTSSLYIEAKK